MPIYISFRRMCRQHTQLWYEPLGEENVGHGTAHEVTGDTAFATTIFNEHQNAIAPL